MDDSLGRVIFDEALLKDLRTLLNSIPGSLRLADLKADRKRMKHLDYVLAILKEESYKERNKVVINKMIRQSRYHDMLLEKMPDTLCKLKCIKVFMESRDPTVFTSAEYRGAYQKNPDILEAEF